jgi:hypothetical protein
MRFMQVRIGWVGAVLGLVAVAALFVVIPGGEEMPGRSPEKQRRQPESRTGVARPAAAAEEQAAVVESPPAAPTGEREPEAVFTQQAGLPPAHADSMSALIGTPAPGGFQTVSGMVPASKEGLVREVMQVRAPPGPAAPPVSEADRSAADQGTTRVPAGEAQLRGVVLRPDGLPVAGLEVRVRTIRRNKVAGSTRTDETGAYTLNVPAGRYTLDIGLVESPLAFAPDRLRLDPGENRYDLRSPELGGIRVEVVAEAGGAPVEGAEVVAKERYGREWKATTGSDGRAEFPNLPVGTYRVLLMARRRRVAEQSQMLFAGANPEVRLSMPELPEAEEKPGGRKKKE